jgi:hypothetical protein
LALQISERDQIAAPVISVVLKRSSPFRPFPTIFKEADSMTSIKSPAAAHMPAEMWGQIAEEPSLSAKDVKHLTESRSLLFNALKPHRQSALVTLKASSLPRRAALRELLQPNGDGLPTLSNVQLPLQRLRPLAALTNAISVLRTIEKRPSGEQFEAFRDLYDEVWKIDDHRLRSQALIPLARAYAVLAPDNLNDALVQLRTALKAIRPTGLAAEPLAALIAGLGSHAPMERLEIFEAHHRQVQDLDATDRFPALQELLHQFICLMKRPDADFQALQAHIPRLKATLLETVPEVHELLSARYAEMGVFMIASHGRPAIALLADHRLELDAIGLTPSECSRIAVEDNAYQAFQAIVEHLPGITNVGFSGQDLVRMATGNHHDASHLAVVLDHGLKLVHQGFTANEIAAIGCQSHGAQALRLIAGAFSELADLGLTQSMLMAVAVGTASNAQSLAILIQGFSRLRAAGFTASQFAAMASDSRPHLSDSLPLIVRHHEALLAFGFRPAAICRMVSRDGGVDLMAFLAEHLASMRSHGHVDANAIAAVFMGPDAHAKLRRMAWSIQG